jgi:hypothetical protein
MSFRLSNKIENSVSDIKIIFDRLSCSQNVINHFTESYFLIGGVNQAKSKQILEKHFLVLNEKIEFCMNQENTFQKNIISS